MKALVFASQDQPEAYDTAERLVHALNDRGRVTAQLIDKLTSKVEELILVTEFGVVESTVVVIVDDADKLHARFTRLPGPSEIEAAATMHFS